MPTGHDWPLSDVSSSLVVGVESVEYRGNRVVGFVQKRNILLMGGVVRMAISRQIRPGGHSGGPASGIAVVGEVVVIIQHLLQFVPKVCDRLRPTFSRVLRYLHVLHRTGLPKVFQLVR